MWYNLVYNCLCTASLTVDLIFLHTLPILTELELLYMVLDCISTKFTMED